MDTEPSEPPTPEPLEAQGFDAKLQRIEVGEWPGLGDRVKLELDDRVTVLAGKNGAGKSLLLEAIALAARSATRGDTFDTSTPRYFRCDVDVTGHETFAYEHVVSAPEETDDDAGELSNNPRPRAVAERCWVPQTGQSVWEIREGKVSIGGKDAGTLPRWGGLLFDEGDTFPLPPQAKLLGSLLTGIATVPSGVPLRAVPRREVLVRGIRHTNHHRRWRAVRTDRTAWTARTLAALWEGNREVFDEIADILRSLGIAQQLSIKVYEDPDTGSDTSERVDFASVLLDGTNLGLASDGTLRFLEIVIQLVVPFVSCLLIEEPETAIHPGLLSKLMALFESYSLDRQIVVSTHSPWVIDRVAPSQIRLAHREAGVTSVHALGAGDRERITRYLADEGTLSDFLFSWESA